MFNTKSLWLNANDYETLLHFHELGSLTIENGEWADRKSALANKMLKQ
jgi:hypothetical protein